MIAVPVLAGPPVLGVHYPIDGRFTEWFNGGEGQIGNTLHAGSWDGAALAGEWLLHCSSISVAPQMILNTVDGNGTGEIKFYTIYSGGTLWLSMNGSWGDGTENYTGHNLTIHVTSTQLWVMGTRISTVSDITVNGEFVGYPGCFVYTLSNAVILGVGGPPADYPAYISNMCVAGGTGAYGDVDDISLVIYAQPDCPVAVRETTWGQVKSLYSE
jgi:hypothetical protein